MRSVVNILMVLFAASCLSGPLPEEPGDEQGVSVSFECTYSGLVVLRGWLVVPHEKIEQMNEFDVDITEYWLECESPIYKSLKCEASAVV